MEHNRIVQAVVEMPTYLAITKELFSEEERADVVAVLAADPGMGRHDPRNWRISKGTGGTQRNGKKWQGASRVYLTQRKVSRISDHGFSEE